MNTKQLKTILKTKKIIISICIIIALLVCFLIFEFNNHRIATNYITQAKQMGDNTPSVYRKIDNDINLQESELNTSIKKLKLSTDATKYYNLNHLIKNKQLRDEIEYQLERSKNAVNIRENLILYIKSQQSNEKNTEEQLLKECIDNGKVYYENSTIACTIRLINLYEANKDLVKKIGDDNFVKIFDYSQSYCLKFKGTIIETCLVDLSRDVKDLNPDIIDNKSNYVIENYDLARELEPTVIFKLSTYSGTASINLKLLAMATIKIKLLQIQNNELGYDSAAQLAVYDYDNARTPENDKKYYENLYSIIQADLQKSCNTISGLNKKIYAYCKN